MFFEFFQRHRAGVILLAFAVFSFLCMALQLSSTVQALKSSIWFLVSPGIVQSGSFFNTLDGSMGRIFRLVQSEAENEILRQQNSLLSLRHVERDALEDENNRFRSLLGLKEQFFPQGLGAEVVGRDMRDWCRSLIINKGDQHGVKIAASVVAVVDAKPVLAGRIVEASDQTSKVLLLTDSLSAVSVSIARTGDIGLLEGQNKPWMKLSYLPHMSQAQVGDEVVTVGLGGLFPPRVHVGQITKVIDSANGFFKEAVVESAHLNPLQEVLVLERRQVVLDEPAP